MERSSESEAGCSASAEWLEQLADSLNEEERQVLGELLYHAADDSVVGDSGTLRAAIDTARGNNKVRTRLSLEESPEGMVLLVKGVSAGRLA